MALQDAIAAVQAISGSISGIRKAPEYPPDSISVFPFCVAYASEGTWDFGPAGDKKGLHNIVLELHVALDDLPRNVEEAMQYSDTIPNDLMEDPTLDGTCSTFGRISYRFGSLGWAGVNTIGFIFVLEDVKIQSDIT